MGIKKPKTTTTTVRTIRAVNATNATNAIPPPVSIQLLPFNIR